MNPAPSSVQDVTVIRGDQAMFSCIVNFQLPKEEITYSWKFAGGGVSRGGAGAKRLDGELGFTRGWGDSLWGLDSAKLRLDTGISKRRVPGFRGELEDQNAGPRT